MFDIVGFVKYVVGDFVIDDGVVVFVEVGFDLFVIGVVDGVRKFREVKVQEIWFYFDNGVVFFM